MTTFKPELIDEIVAGRKRQTRRPVKYGEVPVMKKTPQDLHGREIAEIRQNGRLKYAVGRDYAIQPGRGKPGCWIDAIGGDLLDAKKQAEYGSHDVLIQAGYLPLRYRITQIRREDVRNITHEDSIAEGFDTGAKYSFLYVWCKFYDPPAAQEILETEYDPCRPDWCPLWLRNRPDDLYQAWALTFELC